MTLWISENNVRAYLKGLMSESDLLSRHVGALEVLALAISDSASNINGVKVEITGTPK